MIADLTHGYEGRNRKTKRVGNASGEQVYINRVYAEIELYITRFEYHTQLANMSFGKIFDVTAGVYFLFLICVQPFCNVDLYSTTPP